MTRERAHEIFGSAKGRSENLMIIDLIRHDLSGVVCVENMWFSNLMVVEKSETAYQLVSVIEGQLALGSDEEDVTDQDSPRGIHVLKSSLPPRYP